MSTAWAYLHDDLGEVVEVRENEIPYLVHQGLVKYADGAYRVAEGKTADQLDDALDGLRRFNGDI